MSDQKAKIRESLAAIHGEHNQLPDLDEEMMNAQLHEYVCRLEGGWDAFLDFLRSKGYTDEEIEDL